MTDKRIALVETKTIVDATEVDSPEPLQRYQLGNHLNSSSIELDENASLITYEEFHPHGTSAFQAGRNSAEVQSKRYRYTGKERDEETGFAYHSARYYAAWLGRWLSPDPEGIADNVNLYAYVRGNPANYLDKEGKQAEAPAEEGAPTNTVERKPLKYLIIYDRDNDEAKQQAVQAAKDHKTTAHSPNPNRLGALIRKEQPDVILSFGHGSETGIAVGGGYIYTRKVKQELRKANVSKKTKLVLCHCQAGSEGGLADEIAEDPTLSDFEVSGHTESGHATRNVFKRIGGASENLPRFVQKRISEDLGVSRSVANAIQIRVLHPKGKLESVERGTKGAINIVFRELPVIGFEEFYDMIARDKPVDIAFLGMTPEAEARFEKGIQLLRQRFGEAVAATLIGTYAKGATSK